MVAPTQTAPFVVVGLTVVALFVAEALNYLLVFSTSTYKRLSTEIERGYKELERIKAAPATTNSKKREKALELQLAASTREYYFTKMRGMSFSGAAMLGLYYVLGKQFTGVAVAKLPFEPFAFMGKVTHRGLPGSDLTEAAWVFIYGLCVLGLKVNVSKLLGTAPSRGMDKMTSIESMYNRFSKLTGVQKPV